jgi:hypothetical protein
MSYLIQLYDLISKGIIVYIILIFILSIIARIYTHSDLAFMFVFDAMIVIGSFVGYFPLWLATFTVFTSVVVLMIEKPQVFRL